MIVIRMQEHFLQIYLITQSTQVNKLIFHWLGYEAQGDVMIRMQTGTSNTTSGQRNGAYYYGNISYLDSQNTTYHNTRHEASNQGTLWHAAWPYDRGGLTGELNITMVAHSPTASKVDDHFRPYIYGTLVGYYVGAQYRRGDFHSRLNESQNGNFILGFIFLIAQQLVYHRDHIYHFMVLDGVQPNGFNL